MICIPLVCLLLCSDKGVAERKEEEVEGSPLALIHATSFWQSPVMLSAKR